MMNDDIFSDGIIVITEQPRMFGGSFNIPMLLNSQPWMTWWTGDAEWQQALANIATEALDEGGEIRFSAVT